MKTPRRPRDAARSLLAVSAEGRRLRRRAALLVAGCVLLALVASVESFHEPLMQANAQVEALMRRDAALGAAAFVLLSATSAMLAFFSSGVLVPAAAATWGAPVTALLLWVGWIAGGVVAYALGRSLGRRAARALVPAERLAPLEHALGPRAPFAAILLLQLALPSEIPGYLLGTTRYPFVRYLAALAVAELPYAVATVSVGDAFRAQQVIPILVGGSAAALLLLLAWRAFRRRFGPGGAPDAHAAAPRRD